MQDEYTMNITELRSLNKNISKAIRKGTANSSTKEIKFLKFGKYTLKIGTRTIFKLKNKQRHVIYKQQKILKVIEEYYKTHCILTSSAIDFEKAFDSVQ